jgi:regulator of sigma E protease
MTISSLIIFLAILFLLVVVHELGHFLTAKYFKMRVDEFAFGFPPCLFKKKYGETVYSFNLIPLGGYVKIFGENGMSEEEIKNLNHEEKKQLFGSKPWWQRIIVLSGGVIFNIIGAFILFTFVFIIGSNVYLDQDEVKATPASERHLLLIDLKENSPLVNTGIKIGDEITKIESNGKVLEKESLDSFSAAEFVQENQNSLITLSYLNQEKILSEVKVVPKAGLVEGKKVLGANFVNSTFKKFSFLEAIPHAVETTYYQLKYIFFGLFQLIYDLVFKDAKVEDNLAGPIGLAVMTSKVSEHGLDQILAFAAMLSLSLAVFNILPIPALDGGRIVFVLFEAVSRRKIKTQTEQLFHGLGFLALLLLMVFVTYFDIVKALV